MHLLKEKAHSGLMFALAVVFTTAVCAGVAGCGSSGLSEADVISKMEASGLSVEKLPEPVWTRKQRERVEARPETILSVRVTDEAGLSKVLTLLGFDAEWKASRVGPAGVPGFAVKNWFFVGTGIGQEIRTEIETALQ
jgi:hypothetical protein